MFRIGDFSKISGLSIETLYYYEKIELLVPEYIDRTTNYRYYSSNQFVTANKILVFKDAGFSLEQITDIMRLNPSTEELISLLNSKIKELEEKLERETQRLKRVKTNTLLFKNGNIPRFGEVSIKKVGPILVASLKNTADREKEVDLERMWERLKVYANKQGSRPSKSGIVIYTNVEDIERLSSNVDLELALPISKPFESCATIKVHELEPVDHMACIVHSGPPQDIKDTYNIMARWLEQNSYRFAHSVRKIYYEGIQRGNIRSEHFTELQLPLVGNF